MRYFDEGKPRRVPEGLTMPFEDHRFLDKTPEWETNESVRPKLRDLSEVPDPEAG